MKTPVLSGAFPAGVSGTRYLPLSAGATAGWGSTRQTADVAMPIAGTFRNLRVAMGTAPGTGNSWTFALFVNGVATSLSAAVSDGAASATDLSNAVHVDAGDLVCWRNVSTGTPTSSGNIQLGCEFEADSFGQTFIAGCGNTAPTTGTQYASPIGQGGYNATENTRQIVFPTTGTLDLFRVETSAGQGSGGSGISRAFTLRKNGADSALTITLSEATASGVDSNPLHAVTVNPGDILSISCTVLGGTANAAASKFSFRFTPTTDGESVVATAIAAPSNSATSYENLNGGGTNATEANIYNIAPIAFTLKSLYLSANTPPGASPKQFVVTSRVNSSNGGVTATLSGAATTTASDTTNTVAVSAGDFVNWQTVPSNTPTSPGILRYAAVAYVNPDSGLGEPHGLLLLGVG